MAHPRIQWDRTNLSPREDQLIAALIALYLRLAATNAQALGKDSTTAEAQRGVLQETLSFVTDQFPDLNFRIVG